MSKDVLRLLDEARELLQGAVSKEGQPEAYSYPRPIRRIFFCEFLTDSPRMDVNILIHVYEGMDYPQHISPYRWVRHSHTRETCCTANTFCHQYGYEPAEDTHPKFKENFYKIWTGYKKISSEKIVHYPTTYSNPNYLEGTFNFVGYSNEK